MFGASSVFFMKRAIGDMVRRAPAGFVVGVNSEQSRFVKLQ